MWTQFIEAESKTELNGKQYCMERLGENFN